MPSHFQNFLKLARPLLKTIYPIFEAELKPIFEAECEVKFCHVAALVPIGEFSENDIFIVGYPKSGNMWFQNLVSAVVYGVDPEYGPDTLIQDLVPDVHYKKYYKRFRTPTFFKSHSIPCPEYRRVVYLLRDGRDVMVSYFHFLTATRGEGTVDFLKLALEGDGLFGRWEEHVHGWLSNPYKAEFLVIRYENLKSEPVLELKKFCEFAAVKRNDCFLEMVAKHASFEIMKRKEMQMGLDNSAWPRDKSFFRRGEIGSYRDEMPQDVLEAFIGRAGKMLYRCGYAGERAD